MATHHIFYITDDHLGHLNYRSCDQEALYIKEELEKAEFNVFQDPIYIPEGDCIFFELRGCIPSDVLKVLNYDGIYFREECDFRILDLRAKY